MRQFSTIFWFEFCKILKRKGTWITLGVMIVLLLFMDCNIALGTTYVEGDFYETHAEGIQIDSANARALSGRLLDDVLLSEMQEGLVLMEGQEMPRFMLTEEYAKYVRPYRPVYDVAEDFGAEPYRTDEAGLYRVREELLAQSWLDFRLSPAETAYWQEKEEQMSKPYTYQYGDGWQRLLSYDFYMLGIMAAFLSSICMTGVFYEEHSRKTDQLILSSRLGRRQLYLAKLCAGALFSLCAGLILLLVSMACEFGIYGADGFSAMVQLSFPEYSYPLTLGAMTLIAAGLFLLIAVFSGVFAMVLSEGIRSQVGAMAAVITLTVLERLIPIPFSVRGLSQLWNYLPANLLSLERKGIFDPRLVSLFGIKLTIWQFAPVVYVAALLVLGMVGRWLYCRYQVQGR